MKPSSLNSAVGLLFAAVGTVPGANAAGLKRFGRSTHQHDPRHHHIAPDASNSTSSVTVTAEPECFLEVITMTTTLDITTTITAPPSDVPSSTNMPEVVNTTCSTGHHGWNTSITSTVAATFLSTGASSPTSEPCTEKQYPTWGLNSTMTTLTTSQTELILPTEEPCTDDVSSTSTVAPTITVSISSQTKEPCTDDESSSSSSAVDATVTSVTSATTTEPCDDDESSTSSGTADATVTSVTSSTTTEPCDEDESSTSIATSTSSSTNEATLTGSSSSVTVTPFSTLTSTATSTQTTVYPIDTSMTPITTAATYTMTEIATNTLPPTTTVCETSAPTGTPAPRAVHCGVHGLPVGDYFLGRFVEERATVPVSLEGCWAFCKTAWGATNGCSSYDYYINELGAPRCDLYSSRVAFALDKIDNNQPNLWFDLECGNPTDPKWSHSEPHTARSIRGGSRRA